MPAAAKATIARLYPGVKAVKWEKEDGNYEAGLTHNGKELSLVIDAKGNVLETETTIAESALPASVRAYVAKRHAGKKIKEAAEIVDAKGEKTYEAEVGGKDLIFDQKGRFIK
ncbi:PepSY-like domain-containing protein [Spirosoma koreense]